MKISLFENYINSTPIKEMNIFDWLQQSPTKNQIDLVEAIRAGNANLKKQLPCITPSGIFNPTRATKNLIQHSGLIFIDIDGPDNLHIKDIDYLKSELIKIPEVAYCAKSVRGNGIHLLLKIAYPEMHLQHFLFLKDWFGNKGIKIDEACKDVSRLKGFTIDTESYFNLDARPIEKIKEPKPQKAFKISPIDANDETVWEAFNRTANVPQMLESYGFSFVHQKGSRLRYTRPGKTTGISIDFCTEKRIIYFFTSSTKVDTGGKEPFTVFAEFQFNGSKSEAAKYLLSQNKAITAIKIKNHAIVPVEQEKPKNTLKNAPKPQITELATLAELKTFFKNAKLPTEPLKIAPHLKIIDMEKYITTNLLTAERYDKPIGQPYYKRLLQLKNVLQNGSTH